MTDTAALLRAREARGIMWAARGRLIYCVLGGLSVPATSPTVTDAALTLVMAVCGAGLALYCIRLAKAERSLDFAGWSGVLFDACTILILPLSWYNAVGWTEAPAVFLLKSGIVPIALLLTAINTLALRPAFPIVLTVVTVGQQIGFVAYVASDPLTRVSADPLIVHVGGHVHYGFTFWMTVSVGAVGLLFAVIARLAQNTIREGVGLEVENWTMRERQAELIAEGKMTALGNLVAGIAHELNTPLGAARAAADTAGRASQKVLDGVTKIDGGPQEKALGRASRALAQSTKTIQEAVDRMDGLVSSLRHFTRLDETDVQMADVRLGLDSAIALLPEDRLANISVARTYEDVPMIRCRPRELNQVFMTLIVNGIEAMSEGGTLELSVVKKVDSVVVSVKDTGVGIPPERLDHLFDIGFSTKAKRVGMGLGLPIGRHIVHRHSGTLVVQSEVGVGSRFTVTLPTAGAPA